MRINFRQGLISSEVDGLGHPNYLTVSPQGITLRTTNRPVVFSIASGTKDYTIAFHEDVLAWSATSLQGVSSAWLYIDVNRASAARTYGFTTTAPVTGVTAPSSPTNGQHWFNTTTNKMFHYNGSSWVHVLRVFAGTYTLTDLLPVAIGSQVGLTGVSTSSGSIMVDGLGRPLIDSADNFVTTEDVMFIDGASTHAAKLESNVDVAAARESIPAFHVVRYANTGDGVELADYDDTGSCVLGMSVVNATVNEPVSMVLQGKVHNAAWNWSHANITLWVNQNGQLTDTDPFDVGDRAKKRVPVARTIDSHTIIFDQGLGGVGERGEQGNLEGLDFATDTVYGITRLSVAPENSGEPIAVGTNDPRLTDPRTPLEHTHPATSITVSPFGTFSGTNAQQALDHIQTVKLNLSGGTVTGNIISTVPATQDNHLVTLSQARGEITSRAVTMKRYTLDDNAPTVVQAFNALSPANRTLAVNTVVVVEYRGAVYIWSGGYGTGVVASDSNQFLLVGKMIVDTPPFTIRTLNGVAAYKANAPEYIIFFADDAADVTYLVNYATGAITTLPTAPRSIGWPVAYDPASGRLAYQRSVDEGEATITEVVVGTFTKAGAWTQQGTIRDWAPGFGLERVGEIKFNTENNVLLIAHKGPVAFEIDHVSLFQLPSLTYIRTFAPTEVVNVSSGTTQMAMSGSTLFVRPATAQYIDLGNGLTQSFDLVVYNSTTGAEIRRYSGDARQVYFCHDGSAAIAFRYDFYGSDGNRIYLLETANLPAEWPTTANVTLPQSITIYGVVHVFGSLATGIRLVVSAWNDDLHRPATYFVNLETNTFEEVTGLPPEAVDSYLLYFDAQTDTSETVRVGYFIGDTGMATGTLNTNTMAINFTKSDYVIPTYGTSPIFAL